MKFVTYRNLHIFTFNVFDIKYFLHPLSDVFSRYVLLIAFLGTMVLGPWAGFLASCCLVDPSYYVSTDRHTIRQTNVADPFHFDTDPDSRIRYPSNRPNTVLARE